MGTNIREYLKNIQWWRTGQKLPSTSATLYHHPYLDSQVLLSIDRLDTQTQRYYTTTVQQNHTPCRSQVQKAALKEERHRLLILQNYCEYFNKSNDIYIFFKPIYSHTLGSLQHDRICTVEDEPHRLRVQNHLNSNTFKDVFMRKHKAFVKLPGT